MAFWKPGAEITFQVPAQTFPRRMPDGTIQTIQRKPFIRRSARKDAWRYHLREMALAEEPLRYIRRYLNVEEDLTDVAATADDSAPARAHTQGPAPPRAPPPPKPRANPPRPLPRRSTAILTSAVPLGPAAGHLFQRHLCCLLRLRYRIQRQALLVVLLGLIQLAQLPRRVRQRQARIRVIPPRSTPHPSPACTRP